MDKHKKKMKGQESASGSNTEETELDQLLQNILEEADVAAKSYDKENAGKKEKIVKTVKMQRKFVGELLKIWAKLRREKRMMMRIHLAEKREIVDLRHLYI